MFKFPTLYTVNLITFDNSDSQHGISSANFQHGVTHGILFSDSWADAAKQLEEYYGEEIESMHIEMFEDGLIEFPAEYYNSIHSILSGTAGPIFLKKEEPLNEAKM